MSDRINEEIFSKSITPEGVESFLAGEAVEGIGKVYARRLVEKYGTDAVMRLRDEPESIREIPGLGESRLQAASESLRSLTCPLDLLLFLYSCDIPGMFIDRILGKYRKHTAEVLLTDPYMMVEDVWRLSFFTADKIGRRTGIEADDVRRLRGALLTAVKHYAENGHLFATENQTVGYASEITGVNPDKVVAVIDSLVMDGRLVRSRGGVYLPVYYKAEKEAARRLMKLASAKVDSATLHDIPTHDSFGHEYSAMQRKAIRMAVENPVMLLTGGPGTGKTTVLKGVLDYFAAQGKNFILVAPTGRAAKRMSTLTGHEAQTIHRLLGYRQGEGYHKKTLTTDLLVIDEGSMMEQVLFDHLLEAVGEGTRIIMVGDIDQLPAIGAGDVMRQMIGSGVIPVVSLNENFRQEEGSGIAEGARVIRGGEVPESCRAGDFLIINEKGTRSIHERILSLVADELPERDGMRPSDILVVTPQQMGPLGARQLNIDLQERLNPDSPGLRRGGSIFKLGDPVMQTANSRDRGVYNGETGRIVEIDPSGEYLVVEYAGGNRSRYDRTDLSELILGYATTVHKLQGSEVDYMVMPLTMTHRPMLYRNLLYTGVSRARKLCVLVGEEEAIRYAVDNNRDAVRNTNFGSRLQSVVKKNSC
ncbi:MAG: AAA family ATPase [Muribaculaceae bacterium]|nr:AAA family ATPase [Muribaculaceae bacterium]